MTTILRLKFYTFTKTIKTMNTNLSKFAAFFLLSAVIVFSSCDKDEDDPKSNVMVVHATPDAPGIDVLIDNSVENTTPLTYRNSIGYFDVEPGIRNVKINATGTTTTLINAEVDLNENDYYSIFTVDSLDNISALVVEDDLSTPRDGKAHVRFLHLAPGAPAVDVAVASSGEVVFDNVAYKEGTGFMSVDAGTYNLDVRLAGTATISLVLPTMTFANGKSYTVYARGFLLGTGTHALGTEVIVNQ